MKKTFTISPRKKALAVSMGIILPVLLVFGTAKAIQVFDEAIQVPSLKVGSEGAGGVTFFNGTIVNETTTDGADNPVTFGDSVRIDGRLWRGAASGTSDSSPFQIDDNLVVFGTLTVGSTNVLNSINGKMSKSVYDVAGNNKIDAGKIDSGLAATLIGSGYISDTEFGYLNGVTSSLQTQLDAKLTSSSTINAPQIGTGIISNTEFAYLNGVSSNIQTQISARMQTSTYDAAGNGKIDAGKLDSGISAALIAGGTINNTIFGYLAYLNLDNSSSMNLTALGIDAGAVNETGGLDNTFIGYQAGDATSTGDENTGVGSGALGANNTGSGNTALGYLALSANTGTGQRNTAVGHSALKSNTNGVYNTAVGYNALANMNGSYNNNTAVGYFAMDAVVTSNDNTAVGYQSLTALTSGSGSTAVGSGALAANTGGISNTAVGMSALTANTTASNNTAVGFDALSTASNANAGSNTAVGSGALKNLDGGSAAYNVALGTLALYTATNDNANIAIGHRALYINDGGGNNIAIGYEAGDTVNTGSNNIFIGYQAGDDVTSGSNNIILGLQTDAPSATGSNQLQIGSIISGDVSTGEFWGIRKKVTDDDDGKTLTTAESGTVQTNAGATGGGIWNLPEASTAIGMYFTFVVAAAQNFDVNPDDADQILDLTNAAGDAVRHNTIGSTLTLVAIDDTNWVAIGSENAWTDVN